jgi:hypothetical protein
LVNSGERANFLLLRPIDVLPIVPKGTASPGAVGLRALRNPEKRRAAYCQKSNGSNGSFPSCPSGKLLFIQQAQSRRFSLNFRFLLTGGVNINFWL